MIASCLDQRPKARPDIRVICQVLEGLVLDTLLPSPLARDTWREAVAMETSSYLTSQSPGFGLATATGSSLVSGSSITGVLSSNSSTASAAPGGSSVIQENMFTDQLFTVSWNHFEQALLKNYVDEDLIFDRSTTPPADHPQLNSILALYVIHHLIGMSACDLPC